MTPIVCVNLGGMCSRCRRHTMPRTRGGLFVELAVILAIMAVLTWMVSAAWAHSAQISQRAHALEHAQRLRDGLRAYALRNARLPCPDTDGSGWENRLSSGSCPAGVQFGWFPYKSLGWDLPSLAYRAIYAVFRDPAATPANDADLALRLERSNPADVEIAAGYASVFDLITALETASNRTSVLVSSAHPHLTGDAGPAGAVDCSVNRRQNVAFWLVLPLQDRDGSGARTDGVHWPVSAATLADPRALCAHSSGAGASADTDDVVVADTFDTLAGWLQARAF